jgi:hypothetical protein
MPYLKSKPNKAQAWLPNQVVYGIDCSDPDPEKWAAFGEQAEKHPIPAGVKQQPRDNAKSS